VILVEHKKQPRSESGIIATINQKGHSVCLGNAKKGDDAWLRNRTTDPRLKEKFKPAIQQGLYLN